VPEVWLEVTEAPTPILENLMTALELRAMLDAYLRDARLGLSLVARKGAGAA
jgi:hypothetical protein